MKKYTILFLFILFIGIKGHSQVLISLIFGDKLNSEHIEFGLEGGVNFSSLHGFPSDTKALFNLGFYFDIDIKEDVNWRFNTGVIVKSSMGAHGIDVYSLGDSEDESDLNDLFEGGSVERKISYFNVPLVIKRRVVDGLYVGLGVMPGLRYKGKDIFSQSVDSKDDLTYTLDIKDDITHLDLGMLGTVNYKIPNGWNVYGKYYYGVINANATDIGDKYYNRQIYLGVGIPIGKKKAEKKRTAKG